MKTLLLFLGAIIISSFSFQKRIRSEEAVNYIGQTVTVEGKVFSAKAIAPSGILLLNLGGFYPKQEMTVVIKADVRTKFTGRPEVDLLAQRVLVTGKITEYKGKPEIMIMDPQQIVKE